MHGRGWYARCLMMMCSNLAFQEPSTNATRQRDGWAVRSNDHVTSLLECGNRYTTIILHFFSDSNDCDWHRREDGWAEAKVPGTRWCFQDSYGSLGDAH